MRNYLLFLLCIICVACDESDTTIRQKAEKAYKSKDYATALPLLIKLANRGDDRAQAQVGVMHSVGWGTETNMQEAVRWYKMAAAQGNLSAMNNLGSLLTRGSEGVPKDTLEAIKWYEKCNERSACFASLGYIYEMGLAGEADYTEAARLFMLGASREVRMPGNTMEIEDKGRSEMALANLHEKGNGVQQDCKEAERLLTLASNNSSATISGLAKRMLNEPSRLCNRISRE